MFNHKIPVSLSNNMFKTYLIGSMESPSKKDDGVGWRKTITPKLNDIGIYCFDPTKEETKKVGMETKELLEKLNGWQKSGNWHLFVEYMNKIWKGVDYMEEDEDTHEPVLKKVLGDVDYVEMSDFLIWNYHEGDKLGGTIAELTIAWYRGIPCYLITDCPKSSMNKSLLYFVLDSGHGQGDIFRNQNELIERLTEKYYYGE